MEHLHFTLIPLMSPGHIIPMIDMAKFLAHRGVTVSIIVTPLNATRFGSSVHRAGLSIRLVQVSFPAEEAGLPRGCESVDYVPSYKFIRNFFVAIKLWQQPLERKLAEIKPSPNCIISDSHIAWTAETSTKFQIPRIVFDGMSCFTQLVTHQLHASKIHESVPPTQAFVVPGLPDRVEFTRLQLPASFNPGSIDVTDFRHQARESELMAYGVVVNTFQELEKAYVDEFQKVKGGKVWSIGPLSLIGSNNNSASDSGRAEREKCLRWLDGRNPDSVIYACLGSLSRLSIDQFVELALGLESSNHSFILVVKAGSVSTEIDKWILEEGFEERTRERGLVIRGWAPQVLILSHPSVGGFLTHCGWNSTLEAVSAGLPMITWPLFAEQFLNEKLVVEVLGTGVGVGARGWCILGRK